MKFLQNIKYLSFSKITNLCKLFVCYQKAKIGIRPSKIPSPAFASYEPTNICNLSCLMCPSGNGELTRKRGFADFETYKKFIKENSRYLITLILHFQGEPLMCKQIHEMIKLAHENNIYTMFSTNAQLLAEQIEDIRKSKPDKIVISLDGLSSETYTKYRIGGNIQNVFDGLEKLSKLRNCDRPFVELQFLVFSYNEHEIKTLQNLKTKYKIDKITLKSAQIYDKSQINFLAKNKKFTRYKIDKDGNFKIKNEIKNKCKRVIFGSVITHEGNVVPCCFDKNAKYIFGNINSQTLDKIRQSDKYKIFIGKVFSERNNIDICNNCTEGIRYE